MNSLKRALAVLLTIVILVCSVQFMTQAEEVTSFQVGDLIQFGTYPQMKVAETTALQNAANAATWKSYDYYTGTGSTLDGNMTVEDYMKFADFFCGGAKYRAVKFTQYRPFFTGYQTDASRTYQDNNDYAPNNIYYFKYEPLTWRILDPSTGYIMCENIVDSQAYQDTIYFNGSEFYQAIDSSVYANDYATSSIRDWLNHDFFETAFTDYQKENIKTTSLNNEAYSSQYNSAATNDKIFLPSYADVLNSSYGFSFYYTTSDSARQTQGTDYAKCQGLFVNTGSEYSDNSCWWLRTPDYHSYGACNVNPYGQVNISNLHVNCTYEGVRPACMLSNLSEDISQSDYLFSADTYDHMASETVIENELPATCKTPSSYENVTYCSICGEELSRETIYVGEPDPNAHDPQIGQTVAPTCTETGYTPFICTYCGEIISKGDLVDPLKHDWDNGSVILEPTCSTTGIIRFTCKRDGCGATDEKELPCNSNAHVLKTVVISPTCTEPGYTSHLCTLCKFGYSDNEVPALKHDWDDGEVILAPTCSTTGIIRFNCKREGCDAVQEKELGKDSNAHVLKTVVTSPTCTDEGYTSHLCTLCRYGYSDTYVPANGHTLGTPVKENETSATCTVAGKYELATYCTACGDEVSRKTITIDKRPHVDTDKNGKCDNCGAQMTGGNHCKYCGKVHDGLFGWLISFFHSILAIFKR